MSEPEPEIAVVPGGPRDYLVAHPSCPPLVLEVAEATLPLDRHHKRSLYARAQVPDYWLVNLRIMCWKSIDSPPSIWPLRMASGTVQS